MNDTFKMKIVKGWIALNKAERLQNMLLFLKDKTTFNLKDLMTRFGISKSTALRDIKALESLGLPIYAEYGKYGCYRILKNRLLSPLIFSLDEVYGLYFAMLTLKSYESLPFQLTYERLKQKFENCLSPSQMTQLEKMQKVFQLAAPKQVNASPLLKEIMLAAIANEISTICYLKDTTEQLVTLQFCQLTAVFGQWYALGYVFEKQQIQVFRCDKILALEQSVEAIVPVSFEAMQASAQNIFRREKAIEFEVEVTKRGADLFQKEHYPSMQLLMADSVYKVTGFYNPGEETFIANYFSAYGKEIKHIFPKTLQKLMVSKLQQDLAYFTELE